MATVIEKPDPAAKYATKVDEQLAEATGRIRGHDLAFGGLLVAGLVLAYAAGVMVLDKSVNLPEWVRQVLLLAFASATGAVAYRAIVRPLRWRVNPLYAAVVVERTIDDAKNSVVGYVEAQGRGDVHPSVKAAMGARAAKTVGDADLNRAVDHRSVAYAGGVVVALFLALVVLFFVFRPAQFQSLLGRAFVPFSSDPITSQTSVTILEPQGGDVTVTGGQSVTVRVEVGGRVPKPDAADRVRVRVRYTPTATEYDELPLEPGETARSWFVVLRPDVLRTGAWYAVAAGDHTTPEYRVTVRTAPLFREYEVSYEFPAYTRREPEKSTDQHLQAIRNTKVSVIAVANRPVREGRAAFDPPGQPPVIGRGVPGRPDALRFDFPLTTPGSYRLAFTAADGERSQDTPPFTIKVDEDFAPTVVIATPDPDEITLPANGQLAVDGSAGDDHGLDKLTLKLKLVSPADRPLADRPYQKGKSFRRESDGTFPRSLEYKDSVEFPKLTDPAGGKVELKEGMVLEYWLEATDNRTKPGTNGPEPDPNVGKSRAKRVKLAPPVVEPDRKQEQDARNDQRQQEEQKHAADQQQKLDREDRGPPPKADGPKKQDDAQPMPPPMDMGNMPPAKDKGADGMGMEKMPPDKNPADPKMPNDGMPNQDGMGKNDGMPKTDGKQDGMPKQDGMSKQDGKQDGMPKQDGKQDGMTKQDGMGGKAGNTGMPPPDGMGEKGGMPQTAPMPSDPARKDIQKQAEKVQDQLNQEKNGGGDAKAAPTAGDNERTNPADQKTNPPPGGMPPDSTPKQNDGGMGASEQRPEGNVRPPEPPANTKTQPQPMGGGADKQQPSEKRNEPLGSDPGTDRESPKAGDPPPMPNPMNPMTKAGPQPKGDPNGGGEPKPASQQKTADMGMGDPTGGGMPLQPPPDAARAKTAPPSNDRGAERPQPAPQDGGMQPQPPEARPQDGGEPKPQRAEEPGNVRPMPKGGDPTTPEYGKGQDAKAGDPTGASEPRPGPMAKTGDPKMGDGKMGDGKMGDPKMGDPKMGDTKMGDGKGGMPQPKNVEPGSERPAPGDPTPNGPPPAAPMPKAVEPKNGGAGDPKAGPEAGPMPMPMGKGPNDPSGMNPKDGPPPKLDAKQKAELEQAAKDLTNPDPGKQQDAREKLDRALGKEARQKAEDIAKGLNSDDPAERDRARRDLEDLKRRADEQRGKQGGDPMPMPMPMDNTKGMGDPMPNGKGMGDPMPDGKGTPDPKFDPKELEQSLRDLNSKDDAKRREAQDKLDKTVGEKARRDAEQLQEDLNSTDPERQAKAREQLNDLRDRAEKMAKKNAESGKGRGKNDRSAEGGTVDPNNAKAMDADPRNRAKSAELTLDQFEKNRFNRDLQDRLGWSQEDYDRFLENYRREVDQLRRDAAEADRAPPPVAAPPRPDNINAGGKVEGGMNTGSGTAGVGGPSFAAPGYSDALRRFQQGATQRPPAKKP